MRCRSCNVILSDYESTRRYLDNDEFIDLCSQCYSKTSIEYSIDRDDLLGKDNEE